jgi:hypothetical protein
LNKLLQYVETLAKYATTPIYFCNIYMNQLQHTSETSETLETYIYNIGEEEHLCRQFWLSGWEPAMREQH